MKSVSRQRLVVALTGGIGCGKSTASEYFTKVGWERLDSDAFLHQEIFTRPDVMAQAQGWFGPAAIEHGALNRKQIAAMVFADPGLLAQWEAYLYPLLFEGWERRFQVPTAVPLLVEVPLLFEKGLEKGFDFTVCVATSLSLQLARLEERGLKRALAEQRISRQWPLSRKMELSHFVLTNDGSPAFLQAQVVHLSRILVARR